MRYCCNSDTILTHFFFPSVKYYIACYCEIILNSTYVTVIVLCLGAT